MTEKRTEDGMNPVDFAAICGVVLGPLAMMTGVGFLFAAIWTHGHDAVTRFAGTGGLCFGVGFLVFLVSAFVVTS